VKADKGMRYIGALVRVGELLEEGQEGKGKGIKRSISKTDWLRDEGKGKGSEGKGKGKEQALFLSDDDDEDVKVEVEAVSSAKKRRIEIAKDVKGKGKEAIEELVLLSSDDDEEDGDVIMVQTPSNRRSPKGKGKAKPTPPPPIVKKPFPPPPQLSPLAQLLQLLPDLLPSHAETLLASQEYAGDLDKIMNHLLSIEGGGYPKIDKLEKEREKEKVVELDYLDLKERQRKEGEKLSLYKRLA